MSETESNTAVDVESREPDEQVAAPPADSATASEGVEEASAAGGEAPSPGGESPGGNEMLGDIEAELAQIEQMTLEAADSIPSLDEGPKEEDLSPEAPSDENSSADAADPSEALGDDDLAAALAEVEQISAAPKSAPDQKKTDGKSDSTRAPAADGAVGEAASSDVAKAPGKSKRFKMGRQKESGKEDAEKDQDVTSPSAPPGKHRLYAKLEQCLDTINRPLEAVSERTRNLIGVASLVTIVVSILVIFLMPILYPHRDAVLFLHEQRAAQDNPPPAPEDSEEE